MARVHYPYTECEEFANGGGMWRNIAGPRRLVFAEKARELMADPRKLKAAMRAALKAWPKSCEWNLTADGNNQRAWLGHAGCYLQTGSPEECTRLGWHLLNSEQQYTANAAADDVIDEWRRAYQAAVPENQMALFGGTHA